MKRLLIQKIACCLLLAFSLSANAQYSKITYIHSDADGTPFAATNQQGSIEWQIDHFPYGEEFSNTEVERKSDVSFAGKPYDEEIGLSYFGGRWYDPAIGRFTSIDPAPVNADDYRTFNRYAYGNNNPYKYVDPDGNLPILIPIAIFVAKEIAAEGASRVTGGLTDFLSVRRVGSKLLKKGIGVFSKQGGSGVQKQIDYSSIKNPPNVGPGKDFTARQRREAIELNKRANGGVVKSDQSGTILSKPQKSQKGVTPDPNEYQIDHKRSKGCGGSNCSSNIQVLSRKENRIKSDRE